MSWTCRPVGGQASALGFAANQALRKSKMSCTVIPPMRLKLAGQHVVGLAAVPHCVPAPWNDPAHAAAQPIVHAVPEQHAPMPEETQGSQGAQVVPGPRNAAVLHPPGIVTRHVPKSQHAPTQGLGEQTVPFPL